MKRFTHILAIFIASFIWGTSFTASKIALKSFPPISLAFLRFIFASIVLFLFLLLKKEKLKISKNVFILMLTGGVLGYALNHIFENYAVLFSGASEVSLMMGSFPVVALIIESLFYKKRFSLSRISGIVLSVIGVILIINPFVVFGSLKNTAFSRRLLGDSLVILAAISWSFYSILIKNLRENHSSIKIIFYQMFFGSILLFPLLPFVEKSFFYTTPSLQSIFALAYLVFFCSILGYGFYNFGIKEVDSNQAVNIINTIPLFGVLTAFILLKETAAFLQLFGGIVVIAGVFLSLKD